MRLVVSEGTHATVVTTSTDAWHTIKSKVIGKVLGSDGRQKQGDGVGTDCASADAKLWYATGPRGNLRVLVLSWALRQGLYCQPVFF